MTIQSSDDIIRPLTAQAGKPDAWVWVEAFHVDRNGTTPMPGTASLEDKWRISYDMKASLSMGDDLCVDAAGKEVEVDLPAGFSRSWSVDIALIVHDPEVQQALTLCRSVCLRLARGDLVPIMPTTEPIEPETP
jgi:hypothetical protein